MCQRLLHIHKFADEDIVEDSRASSPTIFHLFAPYENSPEKICLGCLGLLQLSDKHDAPGRFTPHFRNHLGCNRHTFYFPPH